MKKKNKDIHFFILSLILMFVVSISLLGILKITGSYIANKIAPEKEVNIINEEKKIEKKVDSLSDPLIVPASKVKIKE